MSNITSRIDGTPYEDKPAWETWWRVTTGVDLRVLVTDPTTPDGETLFLIACDQEFVVRPDPDSSGNWAIFRQYDKEPYNKSAATENSSWDEVKGLWR